MTQADYQSIPFEIKQAPDEKGYFEGYASVFDVVDNGLDAVKRGAFAKSLESRKPKMLWQHDPSKVIGKWLEVREDERGLYVKGQLLTGIELARDARELMLADAIDSMSIGYRTREASMNKDTGVRSLMEVDLFEISLVTFPMNEAATITDVKSITTERDFERFLRDSGYSRKQAVALTAHGFKGLATQRDADDVEVVQEAKALKNQLDKLMETLNV